MYFLSTRDFGTLYTYLSQQREGSSGYSAHMHITGAWDFAAHMQKVKMRMNAYMDNQNA